jgi:hypothetical protein
MSAVFIAIGGNHTKRIEKVKERLRAALAMEHPATYGLESDAGTQRDGSGGMDAEKLGDLKGGIKRTVSDNARDAETALDERMVVPPANEKGTV